MTERKPRLTDLSTVQPGDTVAVQRRWGSTVSNVSDVSVDRVTAKRVYIGNRYAAKTGAKAGELLPPYIDYTTEIVGHSPAQEPS